jgi:acetyl-CoA carboxylase biotin carboxyl carrier protein
MKKIEIKQALICFCYALLCFTFIKQYRRNKISIFTAQFALIKIVNPNRNYMDINEIQALIKFVAKSGVSEVELESKGFKLVIKTGNSSPRIEQVVVPAAAPVTMPVAAAPIAAAPTATTPPLAAPAAEKPSAAPVTDESKLITIKAPMIGTFYRSPGPDKPPFVNVGDEIKPGKTLCIIEAMKLFNEIESEVSGRIVKVLVDDAKPVEYDQPLFLVEPM